MAWSALAFVAVLALAGGQAHATIMPFFLSETNNGNGTFTYNYRIDITASEEAQTNDYFVFYDFNHLTGSLPTVTNWAASVQNLGPNPPGYTPLDDGAVPNVIFTYTGASTLVGPTSFFLSLNSTNGAQQAGIPFASFSTISTGSTAGSKVTDVTSYIGPSSITGQAIDTPEPPGLLLLSIGLPVAFWVVRRQRSRSASLA